MSTPSLAAQTKGSETMKRLTSITPEGILFLNASLEKYADADREAIVRLGKIENILGDDYNLDHLKKLVEADKRGADIVYRSARQAAQKIERVFEDVVDSFNAAQRDVDQAKKELAKEVLMGGVQDDRP